MYRVYYKRSCSWLILQSVLKQLVPGDLLDNLTVLLLTMVYPGLSLGTLFFAKGKSKRGWGSESLDYGAKTPGKKFHTCVQRVSYSRLNIPWVDSFKPKYV